MANSSTGEVIYVPPSAVEVSIVMSEMAKWLNSNLEIHPVSVSGIGPVLAHTHSPVWMVTVVLHGCCRPFASKKAGYDFKCLFTISEYYDRDRPTFYKSIQNVRENGMNMTGWLDYFITGLETQMIEVKERGEQVIRRDVLVWKHGLNGRQSKILDLLFRKGTVYIMEFEDICPGVTQRTLQRDLNNLIEFDLVRLKRAARQSKYELPIWYRDKL